MIEHARDPRRKPGGILIFSILAAGLLAGEAFAGQAATQAPAPAAKSKQAASQYGDIFIRYEGLTQVGDRIMADGNVEVHYKNIILFADHMEIDSKTKDVLAVGW